MQVTTGTHFNEIIIIIVIIIIVLLLYYKMRSRLPLSINRAVGICMRERFTLCR